MGLEREPCLERAKPARQIGAIVAGPPVAGGESLGAACQIGGMGGEGRLLHVAVTHEKISGVIGNMAPFVEIKGQAVAA